MNQILANSLYKQNVKRFQKLKEEAKTLNILYNGSNIIQDDIYIVLKNYVSKNDKHLELFRLPIQDDDFCAFTCIREGKLFTVLNSWLPISKQIFATAHELYHVWLYISDQDDSLSNNGSLLRSENMDDDTATREDKEANAFAGLLLVPDLQLLEQIEIYGIDKSKLDLDSVVKLMDIFAVPYKAIVLRLFEENIISEKNAIQLLKEGTIERIEFSMQSQNVGERWKKRTFDEIDLGVVENRLKQNKEADRLSDSRIVEDERTLKDIREWFSRK